MLNKDFRFHGRYEFVAKLNKNTLYIKQDGPNYIEFSDGGKTTFYLPPIKVKGMIMGDRTCYFYENCKFYDKANKIKCLIEMASGRKKSFFSSKKKVA